MRRQLSTPHAINSEGYPFILLFILISGGLFFLAPPLGWLGVLLTIWCVYFFRDPPRRLPAIEGAVVAPADGAANRATDLRFRYSLHHDLSGIRRSDPGSRSYLPGPAV